MYTVSFDYFLLSIRPLLGLQPGRYVTITIFVVYSKICNNYSIIVLKLMTTSEIRGSVSHEIDTITLSYLFFTGSMIAYFSNA